MQIMRINRLTVQYVSTSPLRTPDVRRFLIRSISGPYSVHKNNTSNINSESVSFPGSLYIFCTEYGVVTLACLRTTYLVRQHPPLTSPIGRVQQHIPRYQRLDRDNVTTTPRSEASDRQCGFSRLTAITLYEVQSTKYKIPSTTPYKIRSYLVLDPRHFYLFNQTCNIMHLNSSIQSTVYILVCSARCSKYVLCTICISQRCTTPVSLMQYYARRRFGKQTPHLPAANGPSPLVIGGVFFFFLSARTGLFLCLVEWMYDFMHVLCTEYFYAPVFLRLGQLIVV